MSKKMKIKRIISFLTALSLTAGTSGAFNFIPDFYNPNAYVSAAVQDPYNTGLKLLDVKNWCESFAYEIPGAPPSPYKQTLYNSIDITTYIYAGKIIINAKTTDNAFNKFSDSSEERIPTSFTYDAPRKISSPMPAGSSGSISSRNAAPIFVDWGFGCLTSTDNNHFTAPKGYFTVDKSLTKNIEFNTLEYTDSYTSKVYSYEGANPEPLKYTGGDIKELNGKDLWTLALDINWDDIVNSSSSPLFSFNVFNQIIDYYTHMYYSDTEQSKYAEKYFIQSSIVGSDYPQKIIDTWDQPLYAKVYDSNGTIIETKKWDNAVKCQLISRETNLDFHEYDIIAYFTDDDKLINDMMPADDSLVYKYSFINEYNAEFPVYFKYGINDDIKKHLNINMPGINVSEYSVSWNDPLFYIPKGSNYHPALTSDISFYNVRFPASFFYARNYNLSQEELLQKNLQSGVYEKTDFSVKGETVYLVNESDKISLDTTGDLTSDLKGYKGKLIAAIRLDTGSAADFMTNHINKYFSVNSLMKKMPTSMTLVVNNKEYDIYDIFNAGTDPDILLSPMYSYNADSIVHTETWTLDAYIGNKEKIPEGYSYTWLDDEDYWETPETNDKFMKDKLKDAFAVDVYFTKRGRIWADLRANRDLDDDNYYVLADIDPTAVCWYYNSKGEIVKSGYTSRIIADEETVKDGFMYYMKSGSDKASSLGGKYGSASHIFRIPENQYFDRDNHILSRTTASYSKNNSEIYVYGRKFSISDLTNSQQPGVQPSSVPSKQPSSAPASPTPSAQSSAQPSATPSATPSVQPSAVPSAQPSAASAAKGDINSDNVVNSIDIICLIEAVTGSSDVSLNSADLSGDGTLSSEDLILLMEILRK